MINNMPDIGLIICAANKIMVIQSVILFIAVFLKRPLLDNLYGHKNHYQTIHVKI
jgi:hypothetical protein